MNDVACLLAFDMAWLLALASSDEEVGSVELRACWRLLTNGEPIRGPQSVRVEEKGSGRRRDGKSRKPSI